MLYTLLIGLVIGAVAKFLMPGKDPGGILITIVIGIVGAVLANFIGQSMGVYRQGETAGFLAAVLGSMLLLFIYRMVQGRRA